MKLYLLHPIYTFLGISLCAISALLVAYIVPFYRREMKVDDVTRLTPLDGLRGILCFGVMYHHAAVTYGYLGTGVWKQPPSAFYSLLGQTSVALFFCTTGFLFWSRILKLNGHLNTIAFLRARFFRIAPLYLFSCILAIMLVSRQIPWLSAITVGKLLKMTMMGIYPWPILGSARLSEVNAGVTWTLLYEWAFYFALPVLALVVSANGSRKLPLLVLAIYIVFGLGPHTYFISGIIAAYVARRPVIVRVLKGWQVGAGVLMMLMAMPWLTHDGYGYIAVILTTLVFIPIACGNSLFGLLNTRGLRLIGIVSYSVYLLHGIGLYIARPMLLQVKNGTSPDGLHYWAYICMLSLAVLLTSLFTYRWIEWPFITLEKKHRYRPGSTESLELSLNALNSNILIGQTGIKRTLQLVTRFFLLK